MRSWSWRRWLAIGLGIAVVVFVGGPWVYIHVIEGPAPDPLSLDTPSADASGGTGSATEGGAAADGTWRVMDGSVVGYRVEEVLFGQSNEAVGRTDAVTGSITISGTTITEAAFTVDMTTVTSDESRRDAQFDGRIMETATFPTATFELTDPIELGSIPAQNEERTVRATGELTLHGVTKTTMFEISGRYSGSVVRIAGQVPITFADWGISNPSFGPVTTEDHGVLEFALNFTKG